jgi:hypothetical protein
VKTDWCTRYNFLEQVSIMFIHKVPTVVSISQMLEVRPGPPGYADVLAHACWQPRKYSAIHISETPAHFEAALYSASISLCSGWWNGLVQDASTGLRHVGAKREAETLAVASSS